MQCASEIKPPELIIAHGVRITDPIPTQEVMGIVMYLYLLPLLDRVSDGKCMGQYGFNRLVFDLDTSCGCQKTSLPLDQNGKGK